MERLWTSPTDATATGTQAAKRASVEHNVRAKLLGRRFVRHGSSPSPACSRDDAAVDELPDGRRESTVTAPRVTRRRFTSVRQDGACYHACATVVIASCWPPGATRCGAWWTWTAPTLAGASRLRASARDRTDVLVGLRMLKPRRQTSHARRPTAAHAVFFSRCVVLRSGARETWLCRASPQQRASTDCRHEEGLCWGCAAAFFFVGPHAVPLLVELRLDGPLAWPSRGSGVASLNHVTRHVQRGSLAVGAARFCFLVASARPRILAFAL